MRATYLQFRSPKEQTPSAYFPKRYNNGTNMTRYKQLNESESNVGTFSKNSRFNQGSIYENVIDRTQR